MYRLPASGEDTCTHQHRLRMELFLSSEGGTSLFPEQAGVRKWALGRRETSKDLQAAAPRAWSSGPQSWFSSVAV